MNLASPIAVMAMGLFRNKEAYPPISILGPRFVFI